MRSLIAGVVDRAAGGARTDRCRVDGNGFRGAHATTLDRTCMFSDPAVHLRRVARGALGVRPTSVDCDESLDLRTHVLRVFVSVRLRMCDHVPFCIVR
jgi:hypothetical protein